jgi:hypothetical protein
LRQLTPRTKIILAFAIAVLIAATGCGGGGFVLPHPTGSYSNASLKGTYVFEVHGSWYPNGSFFPYREAGVFTADGAGHITGGVEDFQGGAGNASGSSTGLTGSFTGSYSILSSGNGTLFLNSTYLGNINGSGGQIGFVITIVNPSKVELMEGDAFADGTGTAELQDSNSIAAAPSGTFVFGVHQVIDASGNPDAQVGGAVLANGAGTGAMDQNVGGTFSSRSVSWTFTAPDAMGTGSATMTTAAGTTDFFYYIVNASKFDLLVSDVGAVGSGSAEMQSGAVSGGLSGSYAFGSRGDDFNLYDGVATVGALTANGGSITGTEDSDVDGTIASNAVFPGTCATTGSAGGVSGRVAVTNGSGSPCSGTLTDVFWMVSPSRAFFVDASTSTFDDGTADLQSTTSFSASTLKGQYALAMDGWDLTFLQSGQEQILARTGTLQFDGSSKLTLLESANGTNAGLSQNIGLAGPYSISSNGRITGTMSNGNGELLVVMYAVSGSQAYVLQSDPNLVTITSGKLELQQ